VNTAARRGRRADKPDQESAVLAKIAERPEPDRALSLDALSSVAYGPEAIVLVLAAARTSAGTAAGHHPPCQH